MLVLSSTVLFSLVEQLSRLRILSGISRRENVTRRDQTRGTRLVFIVFFGGLAQDTRRVFRDIERKEEGEAEEAGMIRRCCDLSIFRKWLKYRLLIFLAR